MRKHGSVWGGLALLSVCAAQPASAADAVFRVGSFVKTTAPAPVAQRNIPHGLGETPRAMIFWTSGHESQGVSSGPRFSLGASDGPGSGRAVSYSARHGAGTTATSRRMAIRPVSAVQWNETLVAEADLTSWDATSFTLDWSTSDGTPMIIHFLAIGGTAVRARLVAWQSPTVAGVVPVAVGFPPDVLLHFHAGTDMVAAPPRNMPAGRIGIGAAARAGGEWASAVASDDGMVLGGGGTLVTRSARVQVSDACLVAVGIRGPVSRRATCEFTASGFTAQFTEVDLDRTQIFTLALGGLSARAGTFIKTRAAQPARQPLRGMGFQPALFLMASAMNGAFPEPETDARWGLGAATSTPLAELTTGLADNDGTSDATDTYGWMRNDRVLQVANNETATVEAFATVAAFVPDGLDLVWNLNDLASTEITYLALAPPAPDAAPPDAATPDAATPDAASPDRPAADLPSPPPDAAILDGPRPDASASESPPVCLDGCDAPVVRGPIDLDVGCACALGARRAAPGVPAALLLVSLAALARRPRRR